VVELQKAIGPKTRAIFLAHTLGNPYDLDAVMALVRKHGLWFVEDCCDALGSTYKGKMVGSFDYIATCSFYPAHHNPMGEGGCVFTARADFDPEDAKTGFSLVPVAITGGSKS
jgi:CDP-6-deoxy-D-xylo-4-hexulose-3-dehydrase